jgi:hypothetical protein
MLSDQFAYLRHEFSRDLYCRLSGVLKSSLIFREGLFFSLRLVYFKSLRQFRSASDQPASCLSMRFSVLSGKVSDG